MNFIISNLLNSQGGTVSVLKMYVDSRTETTVWYQFIPDPINVKFLVLYRRATLTKKLFSSGKDSFRSLYFGHWQFAQKQDINMSHLCLGSDDAALYIS
jgi:hypothetical protein